MKFFFNFKLKNIQNKVPEHHRVLQYFHAEVPGKEIKNLKYYYIV